MKSTFLYILRVLAACLFSILGAACLLLVLCFYGQALGLLPAAGAFVCIFGGFVCLNGNN